MNARVILAGLCVVLGAAIAAAQEAPVEAPRPLIEVAILLDTSNSMDGLIEQAKTQLWTMVNQFIAMRRAGVRPELHVALYEYGKPSLGAGEGYIRQIVPLSTDLDRVSQELFALKTNGGDEYCGQVIKSAVEGLKWSERASDLKVILIAGNEPFTQGTVDFRVSCKAAATKGIIVNTIHCGTCEEGVNGKWKEGADLADGTYLWIDQNQKVAAIAAPQDAEIAKLGVEMNATYVAYGKRGNEGADRQAAQETNAASAGASAPTERAVAKSSDNYQNEGWDLVDAVRAKKVKVEEVKAEDLPEPMRKMTADEKKAYVDVQQNKRNEIQKKIQDLGAARNAYIAEERKKQAEKGPETFDSAVIKTVREQASRKEFKTE